jgi:hypothetical protein
METVRVYTPVPGAAAWTAPAFETVKSRSTSRLVAILDNAKPRADYVLGALSRRLQGNGEQTRNWRKFAPSIPIADDMLHAIVGEADLGITALAD